MNTKFCVCFRVWRRWWRWFDDMKTMEKLFGKSPINISKITYFQKYVWTQVFVFVLECKRWWWMKTEDDGEIFADISDWKIMCIQRLKNSQILIKKHSLLYPIKRVFYLWASYDGDSIVSEPAVAPLFSNSIYTATHQKNIIWKEYFFFSQRRRC